MLYCTMGTPRRRTALARLSFVLCLACLLFLTSPTTAKPTLHRRTCSTLSCHSTEQCCDSILIGAQCFDPEESACVPDLAHKAGVNTLCPLGKLGCNGNCVDPDLESCVRGRVVQMGNSAVEVQQEVGVKRRRSAGANRKQMGEVIVGTEDIETSAF